MTPDYECCGLKLWSGSFIGHIVQHEWYLQTRWRLLVFLLGATIGEGVLGKLSTEQGWQKYSVQGCLVVLSVEHLYSKVLWPFNILRYRDNFVVKVMHSTARDIVRTSGVLHSTGDFVVEVLDCILLPRLPKVWQTVARISVFRWLYYLYELDGNVSWVAPSAQIWDWETMHWLEAGGRDQSNHPEMTLLSSHT